MDVIGRFYWNAWPDLLAEDERCTKMLLGCDHQVERSTTPNKMGEGVGVGGVSEMLDEIY